MGEGGRERDRNMSFEAGKWYKEAGSCSCHYIAKSSDRALECLFCKGIWTLEGQAASDGVADLVYEISEPLHKNLAEAEKESRNAGIGQYREMIALAVQMFGDLCLLIERDPIEQVKLKMNFAHEIMKRAASVLDNTKEVRPKVS